MPPISSSTTVVKTRSPARERPCSRTRAAAISIEATPPFMSTAPRPAMRPSATVAWKGSVRQWEAGPGGTTSIWPVSMSERPPPLPASVPARMGRPSKVRPLWAPGRPSCLA